MSISVVNSRVNSLNFGLNSGLGTNFGARFNTCGVSSQKIPNILAPKNLEKELSAIGINNKLLTFKGKENDPLSFENFNQKRIEAGLFNEEDFMENIKPENLLGTGLNSEVYSFSDSALEPWALKVDKKPNKTKEGAGLYRTKNEFGAQNMGQEIARIGDRFHILKKIEGTPHSLENWSAHINNNSIVTKEESKEFLNSIEKIAQFDEAAFDDYAKQLKTLGSKGYKMDSINPNNLLIDYENEKIHIIDFFKNADPSHINSRLDLTNCLLDFSFFDRFYEKLDEDDKQRLLDTGKTIIEKCNDAASKHNLPQDEDTYVNYLANVDKWFGWALVDIGGDYRTRFNRMKELLPLENV